MKQYKPAGYNSLSPYFIVQGARQMIDLLGQLFGATETRRYDNPDGTIMHAEIRIDDTILMIGDASERYPANKHLLHLYVADVDAVFEKALRLGCTAIQVPVRAEGDPDKRGMFRDFAGNEWAVGTMQEQ